jgi:hypothetical protein
MGCQSSCGLVILFPLQSRAAASFCEAGIPWGPSVPAASGPGGVRAGASCRARTLRVPPVHLLSHLFAAAPLAAGSAFPSFDYHTALVVELVCLFHLSNLTPALFIWFFLSVCESL